MISIKDKKDCCGCSACVQRCPKRCISMHEDVEGFLYPEVDESACIGCGLCEKVCPVINQGSEREPLAVYAAKNPDETVRMQSSSGGVFTMLAERVIAEGGVVFGACWDIDWNVRHVCIENKKDIAQLRSSKYLQSIIGNSYREAELLLKSGRKVMFTGTPCQIAGLRHFLRKDYDNILAVDVVCHSVPSPGVWQQYLSERLQILKWEKSDIKHVSFRNKSTGWKGYSFVMENKNGHVFSELGGKNAFMRGFLADLYTRPSCQACPAKCLKSGSDITLGDFWGIGSLMSEIDDDRGVSVVIVNSEKGGELLCAIDKPMLSSWPDVCSRNPALISSVIASAKKEQFFLKDGLSFEKKIQTLCKQPFTLRHIIGRIWRMFKKRATKYI